MKIIAHRGYSGKYPENTMLAFQKAVEAGCDEIELDVQTTADGTVVVIHDETVDRTTDGTGAVKDFSFEQLEKLNAAKLFPRIASFARIPSFEEYCAWAAGTKVTTNIEIKTGVFYYEEIEEKTAAIIRKYGLEQKVMFSSFNHVSLIKMKQLLPKAPCGALVGAKGMGNAGYYCRSQGFEFYHPSITALSDAAVAECKAHGVGLNVWTVNDMAGLEQLGEWDCDGVITNYPGVCRAWEDRRKA